MAMATKVIDGVEWTASVCGATEVLEAVLPEAEAGQMRSFLQFASTEGWMVQTVAGNDDPDLADPGHVWVCLSRRAAA